MTRKKTVVIFLGLLPFFVLVWAAGFLWFVQQVNTEPEDTQSHTDALIVLTGGTERLSNAIELLKQGKAEKLFISGVNRKVDLESLSKTIEDLPPSVAENITLGHVACNTHENALESADWLKKNKFTSFRLVTASYHMPRSRTEFIHVIKDATLIPHPIFPHTVKHKEWWKRSGTFSLIMSEYTKYLIVSTRYHFPFLSGNETFNPEVACSK